MKTKAASELQVGDIVVFPSGLCRVLSEVSLEGDIVKVRTTCEFETTFIAKSIMHVVPYL